MSQPGARGNLARLRESPPTNHQPRSLPQRLGHRDSVTARMQQLGCLALIHSTSILNFANSIFRTSKQRNLTAMNFIHSTLDKVREWAPVSHTSTFRQNGQITPEEFVAAGDYLVYKFPTWSWADASPVSKRLSYLPAGKQFLVT
jgi:hypothetical protein